eukprot:409708_1
MNFAVSVSQTSCRQMRHYHAIAKKLQPQKLNGNELKLLLQNKLKDRINGASSHDSLLSAKSTTQIVKHLRATKQNNFIDNDIYCNAIEICSEMQDYKSSQKIMDLLLRRSNITNAEFEIFFNAITNSQNPSICYKYFKIMTKNLQINPTIKTFEILIKSCESEMKYVLAEEYWKLMENSYHIKPNNAIYSAMILVYSNSNQFDKAKTKFKEWMFIRNEFDKKKEDSFSVFAAYLNVFSNMGNLDAMSSVIQTMSKYKHKVNISIYQDLMSGALIAQKPTKVIEYFQRLKTKNKFKPNEIILDIKANALLNCIKINKEMLFKKKLQIYYQLTKHIKFEYIKYGFEP